MKLRLGLILIAIIAMFIFYAKSTQKEREGEEALAKFHAAILSNPSTYPESVVYVSQCVRGYLDKHPIHAHEWSTIDKDAPAILAMLKRELTPEQVRNYENFMQAVYIHTSVVNGLREKGAMDFSRFPDYGSEFERSLNSFFHPPRIGLRHPQKGVDEFYIVKDDATSTSLTKKGNRQVSVGVSVEQSAR